MQVKDSYELIVIGDQLSGLFLAAGAAQMGWRVLVLQQNSLPTVSYEVPSGRFLGDFATEPVIGLQPESPADAFLRSLGLYQHIDSLFPQHSPALQLSGRRFRLDFHYDQRLKSEVQREFPRAEEVYRLLSGEAVEKGSFGRAVAAQGLPVDYDWFGWMHAAIYGAMADPNLPYPAYKEVLGLAGRSVRYPLGGRSALSERLIGRIKVFGGGIKRATRVEEIVFERGRLAGVLLSSYEGFVRSPMVVGAMGAQNFFQLIPGEFRKSQLAEAVRRVRPRYWRFSFTLLLPEDAIPEGLGTHALLAGGEDFLQVQLFPKDIYGGIPARHRAVVVRTLVPFEPSSITATAVSRHMKKSLAKLKELLPFFREMPLHISPDPDRLAEDPAFQRYYHFKDLDHIPPLYLAYESGLSTALDQREYLDWTRFGLSGLAICSRDVYPLFGTTGEILAAMDLLALLKKKAASSGKAP